MNRAPINKSDQLTLTPTDGVVDGGLGINGLVCEMAFHPAGEFAYLAVLDDSPAAILVLDINPASFTFGEVVNTVTLPSGAPDEVPISLSFTPDGSNCLVLTTQKDLVAGPNRTVVTLSTTTAASPTVAGSQA